MPRIVIFRVGGTITLSTQINITNPYLTIAGFTAPGGGILVKGGAVLVRTSEVIIRNIRVRNGYEAPPDYGTDCINVSTPAGLIQNIIIDHCSASWFSDGAIDFNGSRGEVRNVTVQNSLMAEGFESHSVLQNVGGNCYNISFHNNLYANADGRMPRFGTGATGTIINNLMYNWGPDATRLSASTTGDCMYNKFKWGPNTSTSGRNRAIRLSWDGGDIHKSTFHVSNNISNGTTLIYEKDAGAASTLSPTPHYSNKIYGFTPITNFDTLQARVLANVGAFPRDNVDARIVNDYNNGTGKPPLNGSNLDWPILSSGTYPANNTGVHLNWLVNRGYAANTTEAAALKASYLINPANGKTGYSIVEEFINNSSTVNAVSRAPKIHFTARLFMLFFMHRQPLL